MHPALIITLAICGSIVINCLVLKILSSLGWGKFASKYTSFQPAQGTPLKWQSMIIGMAMRYNNCLTIHIGKEGLSLEMPRFFCFAHPPLRLPWSAVRFVKEVKGLGGPRFLYDLGNPKISRVTFFKKVHRAIQERPGAFKN